MDVSAKPIFIAQDAQRFDQKLGRVIGTFQNARAYEQSFDVVAPIEGNRQIGELARGERDTSDVVARAVHAVGAVVDADVGHEHLQKRNTAPIGGEAVAASRGKGVSQLPAPRPSVDAGRRTGNVVLCGVSENFQFVGDIHGYTCSFEYLFVF